MIFDVRPLREAFLPDIPVCLEPDHTAEQEACLCDPTPDEVWAAIREVASGQNRVLSCILTMAEALMRDLKHRRLLQLI